MKKILLTIFALLSVPISASAINVNWNSPTPTSGYILPNLVNSNQQNVYVPSSVGIKTAFPGSLLDIRDDQDTGVTANISGSNPEGVSLRLNSTDGNSFRITSNSILGPIGASKLSIYDETASAYRMIINSLGKIGFGTTSPGTALSIGNTGANTISIDNTATSTFGKGINLRAGCFSINGTCVTGGGSSLSGTGLVTVLNSTNQSTLSTSSLPVNVRDYGAIGDGSTDDTIAIQNAINVGTSTKRDVFLPSGTYRITSDLLLSSSSPAIRALHIYGAGSYNTTNGSEAPTNIYVENSLTGKNGLVLLGDANNFYIAHMNIYGNIAGTSTGYAIYADGTVLGGGSIDDLIIEDVTTKHINGIRAAGVSNSTFIQFSIDGALGGCAVGANFTRGANAESNNSNYWNGPITQCTIGWHLSYGAGFLIQSSDTGGPTMETALLMDGAGQVTYANSNLEMYGVGSTTIENLTSQAALTLTNIQIRDFGPQNGKYSIIKGSNPLTLENTYLNYYGAHGAQIKEMYTINNNTTSRGGGANYVETYNDTSGIWFGNYRAGLFPTDTQSSGIGADVNTVGYVYQQVGSSTASRLRMGVQDGGAIPTYSFTDLLGYHNATVSAGASQPICNGAVVGVDMVGCPNFTYTTGTNNYFTVNNSGMYFSPNGTKADISFNSIGGTTYAGLTGTQTDDNAYSGVAIGHSTLQAGTFNSVMQVYANGRVGIGTTTPYAKFSIDGGSSVLGVNALAGSFTATSTTATSTVQDLRAANYFSGDGTQGFTGTCTIVGLVSITVKDGLITSCQ